MHPPTALRPGTRRIPIRALLTTILCLSLGLVLPPATAHAADPELLTNADFTNGTKGWVTNGTNQVLTVSGGVAKLTTKKTGSATLNDRPNAVKNKTKGTKYVATARVRTTSPSVKGYLRIREVSGSKVNATSTAFTLSNTGWRTVTLDVTTIYAGSALDFNLQAAKLAVGSNLQVDWVSVKVGTSAPVVAPKVMPPASQSSTASKSAPACKRNALTGTKWGVTLDIPGGLTMEQAWDRATKLYGKPGMLRVFHPGAPSGWKAATVAKGLDLSVSFKILPKDILSGANDAKLRTWFKAAPKDVTIYWTYFHEPEDDIARGSFTAAQYRAAWQHVHKIANETCQPNLHATLILMDWTLDSRSGRKFADYYPGSTYVDVLSWDPYNPWGGTIYKGPKEIFEKVALKSKAEGKPFAIAETGSLLMNGDKGPGRAAWIASMSKYLRDKGALYVSYFDTNASGREFRLTDKQSQAAWRAVVQS